MARQQRNVQGRVDKSWADALYQWAQAISTPTGYLVQVSMYPSRRLGVWRVTARALHNVDGRPSGIVVQVASDYPNGDDQGFLPFLIGLLARLDNALGAGTPLEAGERSPEEPTEG